MHLRSIPDAEVDRLGLGLSGPDGALTEVAARLRDLAPLSSPIPVQGSLDLDEYFAFYAQGERDAAHLALRSSQGSMKPAGGINCKSPYLVDHLEAIVRRGEAAMVYLDWLGYGIEEHPDRPNVQQAHSTSLFVLPEASGGWRAFHFNPHGRITENDRVYEQYRTRTRLRALQLPQALDTWIVSQLIGCLNDQLDIKVAYGPGRAYNYLGPNLQAGDMTGICYVFPLLIQYIMACDGPRTMLKAMARGRGNAVITRTTCALGGFPCPANLDIAAERSIEAFIKVYAGEIGRHLPLLLLRAVACINRIAPKSRESPSRTGPALGYAFQTTGQRG